MSLLARVAALEAKVDELSKDLDRAYGMADEANGIVVALYKELQHVLGNEFSIKKLDRPGKP
jgi:hypothetical protein